VNSIAEIREFYEKFLPVNSTTDNIWFEVNKVPLKWHIPFGVLIDNIYGCNYNLPIYVIVHFRNFPENTLIRYKGIESLKFYYMNSLKEV